LDTPEFRVQRVLVTVADDRNGCLPNGEKAGDQQSLILIEEQFNAAWSKNQFLAAGIAAASGEHIIICDADVWITSELLERISAVIMAVPASGVLYGLCGRRQCSALPVQGDTPRLRLDRHLTVIGYFQVVQRADTGRWSMEKQKAWGAAHDDWRLYHSFGPEFSVALPFSCYHLGDINRHWDGFQGSLNQVDIKPPALDTCAAGLSFAPLLRGKTVLMLNVFGTAEIKTLAEVVSEGKVLAVDPWELNQSEVKFVEDLPMRLRGVSGWKEKKWEECCERILRGEKCPPLEECVHPLFLDLIRADRAFTRQRFLNAVHNDATLRSQGGGIEILGENGVDPFDEIQTKDINAVWISGEISYTNLLVDIPKWLSFHNGVPPKGGVAFGGEAELLVCGAWHDVVHWPESTVCIEMLLGTPEVLTENGKWFKRISRETIPASGGPERLPVFPLPLPLRAHERRQEMNGKIKKGVVFHQFSRGEKAMEDLLLSLHFVRKHWSGDITVLFCGTESPSTRITCARYAAFYQEVPMMETFGDFPSEPQFFASAESHVEQWSPYLHTLWIEAGLTGVSESIGRWVTESEDFQEKSITTLCSDLKSGKEQEDERATLEIELMLAWSITVRVRCGATVVMGVTADDLPAFEKNWTVAAWRHAAAAPDEECWIQVPVPVALVLFGVDEPDVRHKMRHRRNSTGGAGQACGTDCRIEPFQIHEDDQNAEYYAHCDEPHWVHALAAAAKHCRTDWLIYLDPLMRPSPGAELFLPHRLRGSVMVASGWSFRMIGELEKTWIDRIFLSDAAPSPARSDCLDLGREIPRDLSPGRILKHLKLGPSATLMKTSLMREAFAEWRVAFFDIPFEIFLTLRMKRDCMDMEVTRPQDWGWTL